MTTNRSTLELWVNDKGEMGLNLTGNNSIAEILIAMNRLSLKLLSGQYTQEKPGAELKARNIDEEISRK